MVKDYFFITLKTFIKVVFLAVFFSLGITLYSLFPYKLATWNTFFTAFQQTFLDFSILFSFFAFVLLFSSFMELKPSFVKILLPSLILAAVLVGFVVPFSCYYIRKIDVASSNESQFFQENDLLKYHGNLFLYSFEDNLKEQKDTITLVADTQNDPRIKIVNNLQATNPLNASSLIADFLPQSEVYKSFSRFFSPIVNLFKNSLASGILALYCFLVSLFVLVFSIWPAAFYTSWRLLNLFLLTSLFLLVCKLFSLFVFSEIFQTLSSKLSAIPSHLLLLIICMITAAILLLTGIGILKLKSLLDSGYDGAKENV